MRAGGVGSKLGTFGKVLEVFPGVEGTLVDLAVFLVYSDRECGEGLWVRSCLDLD